MKRSRSGNKSGTPAGSKRQKISGPNNNLKSSNINNAKSKFGKMTSKNIAGLNNGNMPAGGQGETRIVDISGRKFIAKIFDSKGWYQANYLAQQEHDLHQYTYSRATPSVKRHFSVPIAVSGKYTLQTMIPNVTDAFDIIAPLTTSSDIEADLRSLQPTVKKLKPQFRALMNHLSSIGVVHGDLTENNLLVSGYNTDHPLLVLIDFGKAHYGDRQNSFRGFAEPAHDYFITHPNMHVAIRELVRIQKSRLKGNQNFRSQISRALYATTFLRYLLGVDTLDTTMNNLRNRLT